MSMGASSARIPVDPIVGLHVFGLPITSLALLVVVFGVGVRLARKRPGTRGRDRRSRAERPQELATAERVALRSLFIAVTLLGSPLLGSLLRRSLTSAARRPPSRSA
jgi:hypothetical protein